jgi:hypothetical protein
VDWVGHDLDRDGLIDEASVDHDNDGSLETRWVDRDGDGWLDERRPWEEPVDPGQAGDGAGPGAGDGGSGAGAQSGHLDGPHQYDSQHSYLEPRRDAH